MPESHDSPELPALLDCLDVAAAGGQLSGGAIKNIRHWLTSPAHESYFQAIAEHITAGQWQALDDAFWTIIPFGTGGRRGRMYPIGSNAINDRTIGESAQGLADYVRSVLGEDGPLSCAIAYDTRHRSIEFSRLCAEVLAAAGFTIYMLDGHRSTPELSLTVREKKCSCGIMVTASHNPPSDNAVKVYWSTGCQLLPPHDAGVIDRVMNVGQISRMPFDEALAAGKVIYCQDEMDARYVEVMKAQSLGESRDLKILYSPLHGVGTTAIVPALAADGFGDVEVFALHAEPNGDFPNVPGHVSNPENRAVFDAIIERGKVIGADLIIASDPDCDRIGCAAPETSDPSGDWATLSGNQIGSLLAEFILASRKKKGQLRAEHYVAKTLVTTEMIRRIADSYGVITYGDLLVGFKWIGGLIDEKGPDRFIFGTEESHGYLVGQYARDKDGGVAAMLLAELAAEAKASGESLHQKLESLFWQYGYHSENTISIAMSGSEGMARMKAVMRKFRQSPPDQLARIAVTGVRDYQTNTLLDVATGNVQPLSGPTGDMVILDLAATGNYVAVRPSGTEPKVKFYMFSYEPPEQLSDLRLAREMLSERLARIEADLRTFALT